LIDIEGRTSDIPSIFHETEGKSLENLKYLVSSAEIEQISPCSDPHRANNFQSALFSKNWAVLREGKTSIPKICQRN
jgi:hypothetical protein